MKYRLVITHDGKFHADEILAISLAITMKVISWSTPIERRKRGMVAEEEFNDPTVLILDVGRIYKPELGNFDHHQNKNLEATNILLLNFLLFDQDDLRNQLAKKLFQQISDVDRGIKSKNGLYADFNTIIRNFNGIHNGFAEAIKLAHNILRGYISHAKYCMRTRKYWDTYQRISEGKIAIMTPTDRYVGEWQEFAERDGVYLLLLPNKDNKNYYNLMSCNVDLIKIPIDTAQHTLNNSGHFAVYVSYNEALRHAKQLVYNLVIK